MKQDKLEKFLTERFDRIEGRFNNLEGKVDELRTSTIPSLQQRINAVETESKVRTKIYGGLWGTAAVIISGIGVAVAYFRG